MMQLFFISSLAGAGSFPPPTHKDGLNSAFQLQPLRQMLYKDVYSFSSSREKDLHSKRRNIRGFISAFFILPPLCSFIRSFIHSLYSSLFCFIFYSYFFSFFIFLFFISFLLCFFIPRFIPSLYSTLFLLPMFYSCIVSISPFTLQFFI